MRVPFILALLTFLHLSVLVASQPGVEAETALVEGLETALVEGLGAAFAANTSSTHILDVASAVAVAVTNDLAAAHAASRERDLERQRESQKRYRAKKQAEAQLILAAGGDAALAELSRVRAARERETKRLPSNSVQGRLFFCESVSSCGFPLN